MPCDMRILGSPFPTFRINLRASSPTHRTQSLRVCALAARGLGRLFYIEQNNCAVNPACSPNARERDERVAMPCPGGPCGTPNSNPQRKSTYLPASTPIRNEHETPSPLPPPIAGLSHSDTWRTADILVADPSERETSVDTQGKVY